MPKSRVLVTSALPYVNNVPHLGNLVCIISADVYTRFLRLKGRPVIYVLGTDEHGTTTETRAIKEGLTPREVCDKYAAIHKKIYDWFECSPDCWGRSSSQANHELAKEIFLKLYRNGYIIEGEVEQAFCEHCQRFLSDRYVFGECPHCSYNNARGDQCEKCGKLLEPKLLLNPRCELCGSKPVFKTSKHLFIDLPRLAPKLKAWIARHKARWSNNAVTMTEAWLKEGLQPRCITRDLQWGIPVPLKGFEHKVFYSWFDAPIAYIGITKENRKDWREWWLNPEQVSLVQFMGKDNIPFHTILFPASLIGTGDNYTLLDQISVNEYLNYEGGMFSKSKQVGVFGDDAMSTGLPADSYRYYLMVNRPEKADTEFAWQDFTDKHNLELVANLGNLTFRTLSFIQRYTAGVVPGVHRKELVNLKAEIQEWRGLVKSIEGAMERVELKRALREIMELSKLGNRIFQKSEPWKSLKTEPAKAETALNVLSNLVKDLAILVFPFMPATAQSLQSQLGIQQLEWKDLGRLTIKKGHKIGEPRMLFTKIEPSQTEQLKKRFSGVQQKAIDNHPFSRLKLVVAEILQAEEHPRADRLFVLKIRLGAEERQLVAGIRAYFSKKELIGRRIVVVANLEPATLRGIESQGMLLAAVAEGKLKLVEAPGSSPGTEIFVEGIPSNPPPRISINEFKQAGLQVQKGRIVSAPSGMPGSKPLATPQGELSVDMPDGTPVE